MKDKIAISLLFLFTTSALHAQIDSLQVEEQTDSIKPKKQRMYDYKAGLDIPLIAAATVLTLFILPRFHGLRLSYTF